MSAFCKSFSIFYKFQHPSYICITHSNISGVWVLKIPNIQNRFIGKCINTSSFLNSLWIPLDKCILNTSYQKLRVFYWLGDLHRKFCLTLFLNKCSFAESRDLCVNEYGFINARNSCSIARREECSPSPVPFCHFSDRCRHSRYSTIIIFHKGSQKYFIFCYSTMCCAPVDTSITVLAPWLARLGQRMDSFQRNDRAKKC